MRFKLASKPFLLLSDKKKKMDSFNELCKKGIPPIRSSNSKLASNCRNKTAWTRNIAVYVVEILFDATAEVQMGKALKEGFFFCFLRLEMDQNLKQNCWCLFGHASLQKLQTYISAAQAFYNWVVPLWMPCERLLYL